MNPEIRPLSEDQLPAAVADHVLGLLAEAQSRRGVAALVLTGGTVSRLVHRAIRQAADRIDWSRVDVWWGDERFVAGDDPERNAGQAWADLLQHLPLDPERVHAMPAADDDFASAEAAAWDHARQLRAAYGDRPVLFDVLMLGVGPDGHCASLFPDRAEVHSSGDVLAVVDAPKPPPTRLTMGMGLLRSADHVVFAATGAEKAPAVARAVAGDELSRTPAAGPRGRRSTTWFLDEEAAGALG